MMTDPKHRKVMAGIVCSDPFQGLSKTPTGAMAVWRRSIIRDREKMNGAHCGSSTDALHGLINTEVGGTNPRGRTVTTAHCDRPQS